ncbi:MAG TPA: HK97 family phage prohead protease, partial [Rhizomicrobium sp.]|nr:HK97 family phage prohead protease [Rhizomicrobium sp.]
MALHRAYGFLHVKALDAERRIISGIASTPEPDRMGDIIEPLGITFKNPLPLLLYHDSQRPVGRVTFSAPTKEGLGFDAELPTVLEPGTVRDRIEEAWTSIKAGLLAGVSIGFRPIEETFNKATNGFRFLKSEVLELSLVAIPANPGATIQSIKALDLAATGPARVPVVRADDKAAPRMKQTIAEQITA